MAVHAPDLHLFQGVCESKMTGQAASARTALLFVQRGGKDSACQRHLKSSLGGRAISHGRAESFIARCRTTWLRQVLVCASKSEESKHRVWDGVPG